VLKTAYEAGQRDAVPPTATPDHDA
jgi:hypothetical protein